MKASSRTGSAHYAHDGALATVLSVTKDPSFIILKL
jgi:hypothetical protein